MFKEMHERGMTVSEIARRTGVSKPTVRKYIGSVCALWFLDRHSNKLQNNGKGIFQPAS